MKRIMLYILLISSTTSSLFSMEMAELAQKLNLQAGTKASVQWKRVFSSQRHMKRYKIDSLKPYTRIRLEAYLIKHAADSDQPIVPGL